MKTSITLANRLSEWIKRILVTAFWLSIWFIVAYLINDNFLFPSPLSVFTELENQIKTWDYWLRIFTTSKNLFLGLALSSLLGLVFSLLSIYSSIFKALVKPFVGFLKAVPIVSFIIILLVWIRASSLGAYIAFIMGLPLIYDSCLLAFEGVNKDILDMAKSFKASFLKRLLYVYLPICMPAIKRTIVNSSPLMLKAALAAELIGLSRNSIGEAIYYSKIYLDSINLIMWTFTIIILSGIYESLLKLILGENHA